MGEVLESMPLRELFWTRVARGEMGVWQVVSDVRAVRGWGLPFLVL